jgi:hypothetical protein
VPDVRVLVQRVAAERERLERGVKVGDAVLGEQAGELQPADGVFAWGGREDGARGGASAGGWGQREMDVRVVVVEGLELGKVAVEGGDVAASYAPVRADFEDGACAIIR